MIISVVGSGGKTTLIKKLAARYRSEGKTVLITTTTHMLIEKDTLLTDDAGVIMQALKETGCVMAGIPDGEKFKALSRKTFDAVCTCADVVLVEADGSKGLPLKAHLPHEPVIPACANQVIQVVGLSGLGTPIKEAVHRPERFAELCGCTVEDLATPERVAKVLNTEALADLYVVTQAGQGRELARLLHAGCKMLHAE